MSAENTLSQTGESQHLTNIRRCFNKALDASLQLAIKAEDWSTAHDVARFTARNWLEKDDSVVEKNKIAEVWNAWKNSTGSQLTGNPELSTIMECLWPPAHSSANASSEPECSNRSILTQFLRCLDRQVFADPEVINQFSGFIYFVDAGIQLKASPYDKRKQYYAALASCLCALRCFCGCFDLKSSAGINWKQAAVASAMRLAEVCEELYIDAEEKKLNQEIKEVSKEIQLLENKASQANVDKILSFLHKLREQGKRNRVGENLVAADKLIIETYKMIGDKEKAALWERTLKTDCVEHSIKTN